MPPSQGLYCRAGFGFRGGLRPPRPTGGFSECSHPPAPWAEDTVPNWGSRLWAQPCPVATCEVTKIPQLPRPFG